MLIVPQGQTKIQVPQKDAKRLQKVIIFHPYTSHVGSFKHIPDTYPKPLKHHWFPCIICGCFEYSPRVLYNIIFKKLAGTCLGQQSVQFWVAVPLVFNQRHWLTGFQTWSVHPRSTHANDLPGMLNGLLDLIAKHSINISLLHGKSVDHKARLPLSGDSWMYPYQRTPMGNPYISPT